MIKNTHHACPWGLLIWAAAFLASCTLVPATLAPSPTQLDLPPIVRLTTPASAIRTATLSRQTTTPSPTRTPTYSPTLSVDEKRVLITELLQSDSSCRLPCWWGIEPGDTRWDEVLALLQQWGLKYSSQLLESGDVFYTTGGLDLLEEGLSHRLSLLSKKEITTALHIDVIAYEYDLFYDLWSRYTPQAVMAEYGAPERVYVSSYDNGGYGPGRVGYELMLLYDSIGVKIQYGGYAKYAPRYHICPQFEGADGIDSLELTLYPFETEIFYSRQIDGVPEPHRYLSLEKAAGISPDELYERMMDPNLEDCFDTPVEVWPKPSDL